jgi:Trk K+ transport system NAD-binding subunit
MSELFLKDNFEIDLLIHPELEIAKYISDIASVNGTFDVIKFNRTVVIGLKCKNNTEILNTVFTHFQNVTDLRLFVLTITRNGATFFPSKNDLLLPDDDIYIITAVENLDAVMVLFGYHVRRQNFLIIGGGFVGSAVAQMILRKSRNSHITLFEKSKHLAEKITQDCPNITTVFGDASDYNLLQDLRSDIDTAIIVTECDKTNTLSSLLMKQLQTERILTLIKSRNYDSLLRSPGCSVIDPVTVAIDSIIQKIQMRNITSFVKLKNSSACVVEITVNESSSCLNEKIESLYEEDGIIPIFITQNDKIIPAKRNIQIQLNDRITMLIQKGNINSAERFFSSYGRFAKSFTKSADTPPNHK